MILIELIFDAPGQRETDAKLARRNNGRGAPGRFILTEPSEEHLKSTSQAKHSRTPVRDPVKALSHLLLRPGTLFV